MEHEYQETKEKRKTIFQYVLKTHDYNLVEALKISLKKEYYNF